MSFLTDESVLMDLKALLVEAKQKVPPVLQVLQSGDETMLDIGGEPFYKIWFTSLCFGSYVFSFSFLAQRHLACFLFSQERGAAHFAVVSGIVSQTVQSWRPCRPNRSPISDGKTTWLIVQWTSSSFSNIKEDPFLYCVSPLNQHLRVTGRGAAYF